MVTIHKEVYVNCVRILLEKLSSPDKLNTFLSELQKYEEMLLSADELNEDQTAKLAQAQTLLVAEKQVCVNHFGIAAWDAIEANSEGNPIAKAKATAALLSGNTQLRRNAFVLEFAPAMLGLGSVPKHISPEGIVALGEKTKAKRGAASNGERPSLRKVPAGKHFWWKHSSIWYQIVGCENGVRLFNLTTRIELTELGKLPTNASAAQRFVTSWADAFRGYVAACPQDVTALTESELMADVESA